MKCFIIFTIQLPNFHALTINSLWLNLMMAERQGFEPWVPMKVHTLSKRAL